MRHPATEQYVDAAPGVRLWTERRGAPDATPLLLVMGATASGIGWPEAMVDALADHHHVIRYDHRDTGRSTTAYDEQPYRVVDLAQDVIAVLDALEIPRAHLAGLSLGGMLTQLVLADHPDRVLSATLMGTCALSAHPYVAPDGTSLPVAELPPIFPEVLEMWARPVEDAGTEAELDRRVAHWRVLGGGQLPFDEAFFRDLERRVIAHAGTYEASTAHGRADDSGMERTVELARNEVPVLVTVAPAEPVFPPPHPQHLAQVVANARLVEIPGMGHALPPAVQGPLVTAILEHTATAAARQAR
ncbi:alpha/beta fold hydrolase [Streptomyces flavofungini]|uniref:Alpha/beta fold hydrolase n=1 Tax=Streptomyces flavofungini TaxID=68200 RepID=A0ABS0WZQ4_9ACTN|nr:alpha/beta hydrolase [Streptomyces flavofungini]MBJ3806407.1 alpha/beta fold hydrolase [Streptomyces flavofungini]GHC84746.1 hydrolase [Streptomyces flavofungini]